MTLDITLVVILAGFAVLTLASRQIGDYFRRLNLPLISGFLFAGIIFGPHALGFISPAAIERLHFVDEVSLAFIAFAAGSELYLKELRTRLHSIGYVTIGNAIVVPLLGTLTVFYLAGMLPFTADMSLSGRLAVALLAGAILVARSPSSAIAIVNELRARGPFTQTVLGVTMIADVVVIVLFAISLEIADAFLGGLALNLGFLLLLVLELAASVGLGLLVGLVLQTVLAAHIDRRLKVGLILLAGYSVFVFSHYVREVSHEGLPVEILLEPLLICMIGSFYVINRGHRSEFLKLLAETAPAIYLVFFTLVGASLALDTLADTWIIALILVAVRLIGIFGGSFAGGILAGDPPVHNRLSWLAYVTQAGVGLGLAKEVAVEFPTWGNEFATVIIATIVVNQLMGPPLFKWVIHRVGEAHDRAAPAPSDRAQTAVIFGVDGQSLALASQLSRHGWQVQAACTDGTVLNNEGVNSGAAIAELSRFDVNSLRAIGADRADAIVAMLSDEENYQICELAYENFGTQTMVVRLNDRNHLARFHRLGALVVEPATVMVGLLDHFVRSPSATSLLLGLDEGQDVVEIEVRNRALDGLALRELRLPLDTLVLSVRRDDQAILSHGYTELRVGDRVTVMGSVESLNALRVRFDAQDATHEALSA